MPHGTLVPTGFCAAHRFAWPPQFSPSHRNFVRWERRDSTPEEKLVKEDRKGGEDKEDSRGRTWNRSCFIISSLFSLRRESGAISGASENGVVGVDTGGDLPAAVLVDVVAERANIRRSGEPDVAADEQDVHPAAVWRDRAGAGCRAGGREIRRDGHQVVLHDLGRAPRSS